MPRSAHSADEQCSRSGEDSTRGHLNTRPEESIAAVCKWSAYARVVQGKEGFRGGGWTPSGIDDRGTQAHGSQYGPLGRRGLGDGGERCGIEIEHLYKETQEVGMWDASANYGNFNPRSRVLFKVADFIGRITRLINFTGRSWFSPRHRKSEQRFASSGDADGFGVSCSARLAVFLLFLFLFNFPTLWSSI